MRIAKLKTEKRIDTATDRSLKIQAYGEMNDYPQRVMNIVGASVSGKPCVSVYAKFISGRGFSDSDFYTKIINEKGQTTDYILNMLSKDYACFGGFALHVNYNAMFQAVEVQHVPFETVRFENPDDNGDFNRVAIHWDWAKQYGSLRRWKKDDIEFINLYDPSPEVIRGQVEAAGGWLQYKGQVFYFSNDGEKTYPLPLFSNVLTEMNTQEGIANVANRNARNNFLPAGMLVDYVNEAKSDEQQNDSKNHFSEYQNDEKSCAILYSQIDDPSEKPEFIPFTTNNYDKTFDSTRKATREDIGIAFNQPPILRAENVGANFGADLMKNAYSYYNSVTENERFAIERVFTRIFSVWHELLPGDYSIAPLEYIHARRDIANIPDKLLDVLTVNEKRELLGYDALPDSAKEGQL